MSELSSDELFRINDIGDRFESSWKHGWRPRIEEFLADQEGRLRRDLLKHLIGIEVEILRESGEHPRQQAYELRFPGDRQVVAAVFAEEPDPALIEESDES